MTHDSLYRADIISFITFTIVPAHQTIAFLRHTSKVWLHSELVGYICLPKLIQDKVDITLKRLCPTLLQRQKSVLNKPQWTWSIADRLESLKQCNPEEAWTGLTEHLHVGDNTINAS